jgi:hypothetical protein
MDYPKGPNNINPHILLSNTYDISKLYLAFENSQL